MDQTHAWCRGFGHVWHHEIEKRGSTFHVSSQCDQCGATKSALYNKHGQRITRYSTKYPEGYLFKKDEAKLNKQDVRGHLFTGKV